jgi:hypothetical protein
MLISTYNMAQGVHMARNPMVRLMAKDRHGKVQINLVKAST